MPDVAIPIKNASAFVGAIHESPVVVPRERSESKDLPNISAAG